MLCDASFNAARHIPPTGCRVERFSLLGVFSAQAPAALLHSASSQRSSASCTSLPLPPHVCSTCPVHSLPVSTCTAFLDRGNSDLSLSNMPTRPQAYYPNSPFTATHFPEVRATREVNNLTAWAVAKLTYICSCCQLMASVGHWTIGRLVHFGDASTCLCMPSSFHATCSASPMMW